MNAQVSCQGSTLSPHLQACSSCCCSFSAVIELIVEHLYGLWRYERHEQLPTFFIQTSVGELGTKGDVINNYIKAPFELNATGSVHMQAHNYGHCNVDFLYNI